jgi:beta-glucanase (GH16 family)
MDTANDILVLKQAAASLTLALAAVNTVITDLSAPPPLFPLPPIAGGATGWKLLFGDHFTATPPTPPYVHTLWGKTQFPPEQETYTNANISVANSILSLTARKDAFVHYTSGLLSTGGDKAAGGPDPVGFSFLYGYVEMRAKFPPGNLWPALWLMPIPDTNNQWQDHWEIDIMESIGDVKGKYYCTLHNSSASQQVVVQTTADLTAGFHTYGVDWKPGHLDFYFDGKLVGSLSDTATVKVPATVPMYLILNLAVGGINTWPGLPNAVCVFPSSFDIDYVSVYQRY